MTEEHNNLEPTLEELSPMAWLFAEIERLHKESPEQLASLILASLIPRLVWRMESMKQSLETSVETRQQLAVVKMMNMENAFVESYHNKITAIVPPWKIIVERHKLATYHYQDGSHYSYTFAYAPLDGSGNYYGWDCANHTRLLERLAEFKIDENQLIWLPIERVQV